MLREDRVAIVIVAMLDSVHTAQWLQALDAEGREIVLFPSGPNRRIHPTIRRLSAPGGSVRLAGPPAGVSLLVWLLDEALRFNLRERWLRRTLRAVNPRIVHAMETQHAGYVAVDALQAIDNHARLILTLWGSDLNWYARFDKHRRRIKAVLARCDLLIAECQRDLATARTIHPVRRESLFRSMTGGISTAEFFDIGTYAPPSRRTQICVKGYSGFMGRAPLALRSVVEVVRRQRGWSIVVYAASWRVWLLGQWLRYRHGILLRVHRKGTMSRTQVVEMFQKSRIAVMISRSDGLPATLKESMLYGAIPVMARTSCASEILQDRDGLVEITEIGLSTLVTTIGGVLDPSCPVDEWARSNRERVADVFNAQAFHQMVSETYRDVLLT